MKKKILLGLVGLLIVFVAPVFSQCKSIAKKHIPQLSPYIYSGQLNTVNISEGQSADLTGALLGGQEYRVLVCTRETVGDLVLKVYDRDKKNLFDNTEHNMAQYWDFKVNATGNFTIEVGFPPSKKSRNSSLKECVAVLIGFKVSK